MEKSKIFLGIICSIGLTFAAIHRYNNPKRVEIAYEFIEEDTATVSKVTYTYNPVSENVLKEMERKLLESFQEKVQDKPESTKVVVIKSEVKKDNNLKSLAPKLHSKAKDSIVLEDIIEEPVVEYKVSVVENTQIEAKDSVSVVEEKKKRKKFLFFKRK